MQKAARKWVDWNKACCSLKPASFIWVTITSQSPLSAWKLLNQWPAVLVVYTASPFEEYYCFSWTKYKDSKIHKLSSPKACSPKGSFPMFVKTEMRPENTAPYDPGSMAWSNIISAWQWQWTPAVLRWPCCHAAPQMEQIVPTRVNSTWHRAATAISQGHYLALGPGGLIQG